jgi:hypothetical protein
LEAIVKNRNLHTVAQLAIGGDYGDGGRVGAGNETQPLLGFDGAAKSGNAAGRVPFRGTDKQLQITINTGIDTIVGAGGIIGRAGRKRLGKYPESGTQKEQ